MKFSALQELAEITKDEYWRWLGKKVISCQSSYGEGEPGYMVSTDVASHKISAAVLLCESEFGVPFHNSEPYPCRQNDGLIMAVAGRCDGKPTLHGYLTENDCEQLGYDEAFIGGISSEGTGKSAGNFFWFDMDYSFFEEWEEYV